jgi:hypothetical protein
MKCAFFRVEDEIRQIGHKVIGHLAANHRMAGVDRVLAYGFLIGEVPLGHVGLVIVVR